MKIRPLHDRVLVKRVAEATKSAGGIYIPDSAKEKPEEGLIVAVGKGAIKDDGSIKKMDVKKGDKILFGKYAGNDIDVDGTEHLIMREDDILAVFEK